MYGLKETRQPLSKAQETIERLKNNSIFIEVRQILDQQSPSWSRYHTRGHSEDVLFEALSFAVEDGINDDESLELVGIMSIAHDVGIALEQALDGHEIRGAAWVKHRMGQMEYSEDKITIVTESIEDTKLRDIDGKFSQPVARHKLGGYLLDADVSNFGREDFEEKGILVLEELQLLGLQINPIEFLKSSLVLLTNHSWQTTAARRSREDKKQDNIIKLQQ